MRVTTAFKAHLGWLNAVAVKPGPTPLPVDARRIELFEADDREAVEPYHVAGGWHGLEQHPRPPDPRAIIARGRRKQAASARRCLAAYRQELAAAGFELRRAVMLVGRGWLGHDLEEILSSHAHIHVYEGEAVRDAGRAALTTLEIPWEDYDEKSVLGAAASRLNASEAECDAALKDSRPPGCRSWRKEERLLAHGAWLLQE